MENPTQGQPLFEKLGIKKLNPMQEAAAKAIGNKDEVLLLSPTGSGKTLAFLLPVLQQLNEQVSGVQCLIISPTRELALQIESVWKKMGTGFKVNTCYGGHAFSVEAKNLSVPPALLVGTPGRIADHIRRETISFGHTQILVLDEFDKSLDMGFEADMAFILEQLPRLKKRILVSATGNSSVPAFVGVKNLTVLDFISEKKENLKLEMKLVRSSQNDKLDSLFKLLCQLGHENTMVFCNHRDAVERISRLLEEQGLPCSVYHGKLEQEDREMALVRFRNGSARFLITTDLGSRGLDIPDVRHIVHYQLPLKEEDFIHRNGRTARMNAGGTAYLVLREDESIPAFIKTKATPIQLPEEVEIPEAPDWVTLYIGGGRKNKINKVDVVGFLSQKGKLNRDELGLVEVKDFACFAAIKKDKLKQLLQSVRDEKIKGKKYKVALAR